MGSFERAARRRRRFADDGAHVVRGDAGELFDAYVVQALHTPEGHEPEHVNIRLGIGPENADPVVYLEFCSHNLDLFVSDLRLAVAEARLNGHAVAAGGHLLPSWFDDEGDES